MARIEGTQSIPSELKELYDGALTPLMPNAAVRKRYPWQVKKMQEGGYKVGAPQKEQRQRWLAIRNKFKTLTQEEKENWYAARPQWHSLMWYFNYFMMSGLNGVVDVNGQGGGVIRDIHHYDYTLPSGTAPEATISVDTCDPAKSVPFFFGAGVWLAESNVGVAVYPYLKSLNSTQMIIAASQQLDYPSKQSVTLIEYI
jgi:hypothetical protein